MASPKLKRVKESAGNSFFISLSAASLTKNEQKMLKEINPCGLIYFKRNIENCQSLQSLIKSTKNVESIKFHAIDEEGGRVKRLPEGEWSLPSTAELATLDVEEMSNKINVLGAKLKEIGINMNMAPNVDLRCGSNDSIVGDRSFGKDPQTVIKFAEIYVKEMQKNSIFSVLKHFPGHGTTETDSHKALPLITKPLKQLLSEDLLPYSFLANKSGFIMKAHLLLPEISPLPASLSREWDDILRNEIGFKGVSIADDMEMHALDSFSFDEKMALFYKSKTDKLLICSGKEEEIMLFFEAAVKILEKI